MKKLIVAIVGPSGSGKTEMADFVEQQYGIKMIESYTDRPKRFDDERGHIFLTKTEMDDVLKKPLIAETVFGGNRYCCTQADVLPENTYVIDEYGLQMMIDNHSDKYLIHKVFIDRPLADRTQLVGEQRTNRDKGRFILGYGFYDDVIFNTSTKETFHIKIRQVIDSVLARYGHKHAI